MKVICNRGALLEALTVTGNVVASRTPKPALQCVKLSAGNNELIASATDLEVAIVYRDAQVEVAEPGEILVPADKFRDIVRESIDDTLSIESEGDMALVKGHDALFKIYTQAVESFPPVPGFEGQVDFEIKAGHVKRLIVQSTFAAAKESTRYAFNGVLINVKGKRVSFVASDGRRLAEARGDLVSGKTDKEGRKVIVPVKALSLIDKLLENPEDSVGFQIRENQITVHTSTATLTSNLVEGQFPPYEEVIPKDCDKKMIAATPEFLSAVRQAALLATEEGKGVRLAFSKKGLVLSSQALGAGESTINFPCKYEGQEIEIRFNPVFLIDGMRVIDTDEVSLELTTPTRPGLLRGGPDFLYVIMPVNQ